jgi:hypothetical protein
MGIFSRVSNQTIFNIFFIFILLVSNFKLNAQFIDLRVDHGVELKFFSFTNLERSTNETFVLGISGKKVKLKKGIKDGFIEEVVSFDSNKFIDKSKYIPDFQNCIINTNLDLKSTLTHSKNDDLVFVLAGNYVNGIKQGKFHLYIYFYFYNGTNYENLTFEAATLNYVNDTINGKQNFNPQLCNLNQLKARKGHSSTTNNWNSTFYIKLNVDIIGSHILDQKVTYDAIKIGDHLLDDYLLFKNGEVDSAYFSKSNKQPHNFFYKKKDSAVEISVLKQYRTNIFEKILIFENGIELINPFSLDYKDYDKNYDDIKNVVGLYPFQISSSNKVDRYILEYNKYQTIEETVLCKFIDGKILDIKGRYTNGDLLYHIDVNNNNWKIYSNTNLDNNLRIKDGVTKNLIGNHGHILKNSNLNLNNIAKGHYEVANIKNITFNQSKCENFEDFLKSDLESNIVVPSSISYQIADKIVRTDEWFKKTNVNGIDETKHKFTEFDLNGQINSSTAKEELNAKLEELNAKSNVKKQNEFFSNLIYGDPNSIIECNYCNKKMVNKNSLILYKATCANQELACGDPVCWRVCSEACSQKLQCKLCADNKYYRKNCN